MSHPTWNSITVGDIAKRSALTWLHDYEVYAPIPIEGWPHEAYQLAIHIQEAINEAIHVAAGNEGGI